MALMVENSLYASNNIRKILSFIAYAGFVLSLLVHLLSLFGVDVASIFKPVWFLHFGLFLIIPLVIFFEQKALKTRSKLAWAKLALPKRISLSRKLIQVYAVVSFVIFMFLSEGGAPNIKDGKYILHNHGKLIRELTQDEYKTFIVNEMRFFSTFWIFFYYESFVQLRFRKEKKEAIESNQ